jgi:hypothetical protein
VCEDVCKYHLESFDSWCWERCETEWTINRLRPALSGAYPHHKNTVPVCTSEIMFNFQQKD